ncbi:MAG: sugar ABC transporter substrate-binding protein [Synergistaceae bacterium]|nr:sugar ABC transporter substrate-binding protein [Synergistaceae bacterium]
MKSRTLRILGLALAFTLIAAACGSAAVKTDGSDIRIAVILKSLTNPFWMMAKQSAEETGRRLGVNVTVFSTTNETDFNAQASQVEDAVTGGYDVICIVPSDGNALVPACEEAVRRGVPVIVLDSALNSDAGASFVASDNIAGGAMAAEYIAKRLEGKGNAAVIRGGNGHPVELERYKGFTEELAKYPDIKIVAEAHAEWEADKASNVMEDFLNSHPEIQAVFCESDMMVIGASQMAKLSRRSDIIFVGLDGIVDALRLVRSGQIAADVAQSPDKIGEYGVKAAVKLAKGETIDKRIVTPMVLATTDTVDPLIQNWEALGF